MCIFFTYFYSFSPNFPYQEIKILYLVCQKLSNYFFILSLFFLVLLMAKSSPFILNVKSKIVLDEKFAKFAFHFFKVIDKFSLYFF